MMGLYDIVSLELDYASEQIGKYLRSLGMDNKRKTTRTKEADYVEKSNICAIAEATLLGSDSNIVTLGSGYYHHFTYGLCKYLDRFYDDYAYIHFDHHNDYIDEALNREQIHCGSFVKAILQETNASSALFIGVRPPRKNLESKLHMSMTERQIRAEKGFDKLRIKLSKLPKDVYLSFDLDVMPKKTIYTAYDQGTLRTRELMGIIETIKETKTVISADIIGYADTDGRRVGKDLYAKIISALMA